MVKINFRLNRIQKYIWSIYFILLLILWLNTESKYKAGLAARVGSENMLESYFRLGWIIALILHFIWKDKKEQKT